MNLNFQTIDNIKFTLNVPPNGRIIDIKKMISTKMTHNMDSIKIIFGGKVLNDNTIISSELKNGYTLIVLFKKPIEKKNIPDEETEENPTDEDRSIGTDTDTEEYIDDDEEEEGIVFYDNEMRDIEEMKGMGFAEERIVECYLLANRNKEMALDILLNC